MALGRVVLAAACFSAVVGTSPAVAQDAAERAASAAEASLEVNEQARDWLVVGLLAAAMVAGFGMASRVV